MRPKGKRQRIHQSPSSAFSRLSSPIAHLPVSPPSPGPASHLQEAPTSDYSTLSSTLPRKKQRIYQSLSSAFSKKSPRAPSPEPFPAGFPEATSSSDDQEPIPGEDEMQSIEWMNSELRGDGSDQEETNWSPRQELVITEETVATQPRSEFGGSLRAAERQLGSAKGLFAPLSTIEEVALAHGDLQQILKLPRHSGRGYKDLEFDQLFQYHLEGMKQFMWAYINPKSGYTGQWQATLLKTADNLEKGLALAKNLRAWTRAFIADRKDLPVNPYGTWNEAIIDKHPEIAQEIHTHLQSIGKFVKAMDLVNFMDTPEMQE